MLVPLFIASRHYDGEVQFLISNMMKLWWPAAYRTILQWLFKYDAVNLDGDDNTQHIHTRSVLPGRTSPWGSTCSTAA